MNNLNKQIALFLAIFLASSLSFSYADDDTTSAGVTTDSGVQYGSESHDYNYGTGMKMGDKKPMMCSGMTDELKTKMEESRKSLEEQIKTLRESITKDNLEEIKAKSETLKQEYLTKADEICPESKKMIEERFRVFSESNFAKREEMKGLIQDRKDQMQQATNQFKDQKQEIKQNFQNKKQDLKLKYKEKFAKSLESKISVLSTDRIKTIITKIDGATEKYNSSTLNQEQKDKFVAQLTALKEVLQDKLDETENSINIEELLAE